LDSLLLVLLVVRSVGLILLFAVLPRILTALLLSRHLPLLPVLRSAVFLAVVSHVTLLQGRSMASRRGASGIPNFNVTANRVNASSLNS
jgi:membrane protein implicated in regulation of membrane protease activity